MARKLKKATTNKQLYIVWCPLKEQTCLLAFYGTVQFEQKEDLQRPGLRLHFRTVGSDI